MGISMRFLLVLLKFAMLFVSEDKYSEKIKHISLPDEKNKNSGLMGWEYRKISAPGSNFIHRYYYYPSSQPGAPVFLLFHGLNLDGRTFLNMKSLSDKFQLVAYDLPENTDRYKGNFEDFMEIVNEFVSLMNIKTCCLAGVSFGGSIALRLAVSRPDIDAQRLVLMSTAIVGDSKSEKRQRKKMAAWVKQQPDYKLYWFMEKVFERSAHSVDDPDTGQAIIDILRIKHPCFYRQVGVSMGDYDASLDAKKVTCPVLWLMGDKDNLFSKKQTERIKEYVPHVEFEVIKGGTHAMVYTKGEEIAGKIRDFCKRHCDE